MLSPAYHISCILTCTPAGQTITAAPPGSSHTPARQERREGTPERSQSWVRGSGRRIQCSEPSVSVTTLSLFGTNDRICQHFIATLHLLLCAPYRLDYTVPCEHTRSRKREPARRNDGTRAFSRSFSFGTKGGHYFGGDTITLKLSTSRPALCRLHGVHDTCRAVVRCVTFVPTRPRNCLCCTAIASRPSACDHGVPRDVHASPSATSTTCLLFKR